MSQTVNAGDSYVPVNAESPCKGSVAAEITGKKQSVHVDKRKGVAAVAVLVARCARAVDGSVLVALLEGVAAGSAAVALLGGVAAVSLHEQVADLPDGV